MANKMKEIDPKKLLMALCFLLYFVLAWIFIWISKYITLGSFSQSFLTFVLPLFIALAVFYKVKGDEKKLEEFVKSHTLEIQYGAFGLWTLVMLYSVHLGIHKTEIVGFWILGVPSWFFILSLVIKSRKERK